MPRQKTDKASYARFELRLPPDLLQEYRVIADTIGRPLNTELVRALQDAMKCYKERRKERHEPAYS